MDGFIQLTRFPLALKIVLYMQKQSLIDSYLIVSKKVDCIFLFVKAQHTLRRRQPSHCEESSQGKNE